MDRMANQIPTVGRLTFRKDGLLFYDQARPTAWDVMKVCIGNLRPEFGETIAVNDI